MERKYLKNKNIILGVTGSVASVLTHKMIEELENAGANVKVVLTKNVWHFVDFNQMYLADGSPVKNSYQVYRDLDEWTKNGAFRLTYKKDDEILHIELRKWADGIIIAPLSANTLAKMANGLCDNLLTNIVRAWDASKPMIVAPSMNCMMLENPLTKRHINILQDVYQAIVVDPQEKTLACGDVGNGAMAEIKDIINAAEIFLGIDDGWHFPLSPEEYRGIPVGNHPGAFGFQRFGYMHSGVDLYCNDLSNVYAVEDGVVVGTGQFTGKEIGTDHWETTHYMMVEGESGVVCYGEIQMPCKTIGNRVKKSDIIGRIKRVLPFGKERPDIASHSLSMLHLELYKKGTKKPIDWKHKEERPEGLLDPTQFLFGSKIIKNGVFLEHKELKGKS